MSVKRDRRSDSLGSISEKRRSSSGLKVTHLSEKSTSKLSKNVHELNKRALTYISNQ